MNRLPPHYRQAEGCNENLDAPSCFDCLFLRTHELRYTRHESLAYILSNHVCDDWQKRPRSLGWEKLELSRGDLKMAERHPIRDLQKGFSLRE